MRVKIITDSSTYLENDICQELDITVLSLLVNMDDQSFPETVLDETELYAAVEKGGEFPTTSQPALGDIYQEFCRQAENGRPILGIFISSSLSGTYSAALRAKNMTLEKYPQACIELLDSQAACMGFTVLAAARTAQEGAQLEEVLQVAREKAEKSCFLFVPASLEYLAKGGRIGEAAALIGTLLRIRPVLALQKGRITVKENVRTMEKALTKMLDLVREDAEAYGLAEIGVGHVNSPQQAALLAERIQGQFGITPTLRRIGPVLGLHLGPGTLGIGYCIQNQSLD